MITLMPADLHRPTALGTLSLGGSMRATKPTKQSASRGKLGVLGSRICNEAQSLPSTGKCARPMTRCPWDASSSIAASMSFTASAVIGSACPARRKVEQRSRMRSGAPFMQTKRVLVSGSWWSEAAYLFLLLNGTSARLAYNARVSSMSSMPWQNLMNALSVASPRVFRCAMGWSLVDGSNDALLHRHMMRRRTLNVASEASVAMGVVEAAESNGATGRCAVRCLKS
mmetsp:Transcript_4331/g.7586  ORF Transcript_4331/g.7586 Transcript_4331/m.7586 type:complete len:227 (+) Transcript_4331:1460-2140(+)